MFASDLDATTRQQLTRGERIMQLLRQQQYTPYKVEDQVASVWAGTNGFLDELPLDKVHDYEKRLLDYLRHNTGVLEKMRGDRAPREGDGRRASHRGQGIHTRLPRRRRGRRGRRGRGRSGDRGRQRADRPGEARLTVAGAQRVFKEKIRATATLEKVFRAMELIAASRIGRAREAASGLDPYTRILTRSIAAVALHDHELNHPMLTHREDTNRVAVLVVTSDRGMVGRLLLVVLREADRLVEELRTEGREPVLYVSGRRGESYYRFQGIEVAKSWTGKSDNPDVDVSDDVASTLLDAYLAAPEDGGVSELIVVYTRFVSMVRQIVQVRHMLPLEVVEAEDDDERGPVDDLGDRPGGNASSLRVRALGGGHLRRAAADVREPAHSFGSPHGRRLGARLAPTGDAFGHGERPEAH